MEIEYGIDLCLNKILIHPILFLPGGLYMVEGTSHRLQYDFV